MKHLILILLLACATPAFPFAKAPTKTQITTLAKPSSPKPHPTPKPKPTPTPTPVPTATPTPRPTATPTPTPIQRRTAMIQWNFAGDPCCTTVNFKIYYGIQNGAEQGPITIPAIPGQTTYAANLPNVQIGKFYYFIIDATLDNGQERYSTMWLCAVTQTDCIQ